jgi:hypothetical protein
VELKGGERLAQTDKSRSKIEQFVFHLRKKKTKI